MTHDPLCPYRPKISVFATYWQKEIPCQCDLIAKVRADELRRPSEDGWMSVRAVLAWEDEVRADTLDKAVQRVEQNVLVGMTLTPKEVRAVIAAVRGQS
jgi:hypothetical protein